MTTDAGASAGQKLGFGPYPLEEGEPYMNERQLAYFRDLLQSWRHELLSEVERTVHHMQDDAASFADPTDRAAQESDFSLELRTRDRERKLLKKIDEALRHLEQGEFGYCEDCGAEIGIRRLEARPTATLCIECKTIAEIREKQQGE
jgi:DnaK suppressor protein